MLSMTGFGIGEAPLREGHIVVEARSVNHRFLDVRVRLPAELADQTFYVEQLARERLSRGRFDVSVQLEGSIAAGIDLDRARAAYAQLKTLRDELAPGTELPLTALTCLPDLITNRRPHGGEELREALKKALEAALVALDAMRRREGTELKRELTMRVTEAGRLRDELETRVPDVVRHQCGRLRERIQKLIQAVPAPLDSGRLETEVAILADRADVTEELVRLKSHLAQFQGLLEVTEPVGRRLDFLLQEMAREANTVGAKCQDADLSHLVVDIKAELSRMREQVQNVE